MDSPVFPHFRVFVEENKGQEEATAEVFEGDIVGCGFDIKDVQFDDAGVPVSNQRLRVYFTRNGGEVQREVDIYISSNWLDIKCQLCGSLDGISRQVLRLTQIILPLK